MRSHRGFHHAWAGCAALIITTAAFAVEPSAGVYRIPMESGDVRITNDVDDHSPLGRIDMGSDSDRVVAAAAGTVRFIDDSNSAMQDSKTAAQCNNNYIWIDHGTGEWTKYTHMLKGTITGPKPGGAALKVNDKVKAGQFLGTEGAVGCATGKHLHWEVGVPRATDPVDPVGGFLKDNSGSKRNRNPRICGVGFFKTGKTYVAKDTQGSLAANRPEIARHGLPVDDYQCLIDQAVAAGYEPAFLDFFDSAGNTYVNVVLRPAGNQPWSARHGLTAAQYQSEFNAKKADGWRLTQVEAYRDNGVRYAAVWHKGPGPALAAYHGLSAAEHQDRIDALTADGFRPVNIAVVDDGGRRYTALYEKRNVGSWEAKSQLTPAEYQALFNANKAKGRQVVYLNGYTLNGSPFLVAIWNGATPAASKARHDMSGADYQTEYESARAAGLLTETVTGYRNGSAVDYAAVWRK